MARVKNAGGGPGDEDLRRPPRLPADPKGKATKKLATKKRKYLDADIARVAAVVEAVERAERGGARSGVWIAYRFHQKQGLHLSELSAFMVVQLGLS